MIRKEGGYILLYRVEANKEVSFFLVKSYDSTSGYEIPGGKLEVSDRTRLYGAIREFEEETGYDGLPEPNNGDYIPLGIYQGRKKIKFCYALEWDIPSNFKFTSNLVNEPSEIYKKGKKETIPEIVDWKWFTGLNKLKEKKIETDAIFFIKKLKNYMEYNLKESASRIIILNDDPYIVDMKGLRALQSNLDMEIKKASWNESKHIKASMITANIPDPEVELGIGFINVLMTNKDIIETKIYNHHGDSIVKLSINGVLLYEEMLRSKGLQSDVYMVILLEYLKYLRNNGFRVINHEILSLDGNRY
jgi:8-oxo-dGTP pyrophosphatase MutT (NUDIX family)